MTSLHLARGTESQDLRPASMPVGRDTADLATRQAPALPLVAASASVRTLAVVGLATLIAALPGFPRWHSWDVVARALLFLAVCAALMGAGAGAAAGARRWTWPAAVATAAVLLGGLHALPSSMRGASLVAPVLLAAAVEEWVFRVQLPEAVRRLLSRKLSAALAAWFGFAVAQVSFALGHVAISGGVASGDALLAAARLFGAGCFLVSVRMLVGLPLAIVVHSLANLALMVPTRPAERDSAVEIIVLCVLGAAHMTLTLAHHHRFPDGGGRAGEDQACLRSGARDQVGD